MDAERPQPASTPQIIIVKKEEEETILFCIFKVPVQIGR